MDKKLSYFDRVILLSLNTRQEFLDYRKGELDSPYLVLYCKQSYYIY